MKATIYFHLDNGKVVTAPNNFMVVSGNGFVGVRAVNNCGHPNTQRLKRISAVNENRNYETKSLY